MERLTLIPSYRASILSNCAGSPFGDCYPGAGATTVFFRGGDHQAVAVERQGKTEQVESIGVGGLDIGLAVPAIEFPGVNVNCASVFTSRGSVDPDSQSPTAL